MNIRIIVKCNARLVADSRTYYVAVRVVQATNKAQIYMQTYTSLFHLRIFQFLLKPANKQYVLIAYKCVFDGHCCMCLRNILVTLYVYCVLK